MNLFKKIKQSPLLTRLSTEIVWGLFACISSLLLFLKFTDQVLDHERFFFDNTISTFTISFRTPFITTLMNLFSFIGRDGVVIFSIIIPIYFYLKQKHRDAIFFVTLIGLGIVLNIFLKTLIHRPRPTISALFIESTYSFPSGHSMNSFIFFMLIAYFYYHFTHSLKKTLPVIFISSTIIILIGVSRIYLGMHYPSDVVAGFIGGFVWLAFGFLIDKLGTFIPLALSPKKNIFRSDLTI